MSKINVLSIAIILFLSLLVFKLYTEKQSIVKNSRYSSLTISWDPVAFSRVGLQGPTISTNDHTVIGGTKFTGDSPGEMTVELVINDEVTIGITKDGEIIKNIILNPGDKKAIDVNDILSNKAVQLGPRHLSFQPPLRSMIHGA